MEISSKLTSNGLKELAYKLRLYGNDLNIKVKRLTSMLADKGIQAALNANYGSFAAFLVFSKENDVDGGTIIIAKETTELMADWLGHEDVKISPLLMTEFGSGRYAVYWEPPKGKAKKKLSNGTPIGRGSFPNQKFAFRDKWFYRDKDGFLHETSGILPTRPLHYAITEMIAQINSTAREVFRNGSD